MAADTLLHCVSSTPGRYIGSPLTGGDTPVRCGRVSQDQIILGKLLGTGGFGRVYVANVRGRTVAVKMYQKHTANPAATRKSYNNELMAFRLGLKHCNVVSVLGATSLHDFEDDSWIVMEYVGERNLQAVINNPEEVIDRNQRLSFALQIARALQYLHSINLVHLDLKPANLLLTSDGRLRLADFGNCHLLLQDMAREREREKEGDAGGLRGVQGSWRCELAGTLAYRAPELLERRATLPAG
ncbi:hypothetical protein C0Q70_20915 [Pomacea canaliculata]|uniref:non-specific serine/threonine protein kinase n=1 Tax=Pomacea canaliculata TaxID=400727 RepID=A0A2T7NB17_POMCA|nr:hypothetical protein C0Q70_20915 [Pomacea canaliculata]